jgi:hypothetical protein
MAPNQFSRARAHAPIAYRDPKGRVWQASEIAQIRVVAPAIDGPNVCLVIRFEHEGEERFAHWIGGESGAGKRRSSSCSPRREATTRRASGLPHPRP